MTRCDEERGEELTVDYRRHRQDDPVAVVDDWIDGLVFDNREIMPEVAVGLCEQNHPGLVLLMSPESSQRKQLLTL